MRRGVPSLRPVNEKGRGAGSLAHLVEDAHVDVKAGLEAHEAIEVLLPHDVEAARLVLEACRASAARGARRRPRDRLLVKLVEARPPQAHGADTRRASPWLADARAPLHVRVLAADLELDVPAGKR